MPFAKVCSYLHSFLASTWQLSRTFFLLHFIFCA